MLWAKSCDDNFQSAHAQEIKAALFGGCGYVPDIGALQAWLEAAWAAGFDRSGAEQLGGAVQGSHKWVGTTEAAALLRFFGVRARVVDFRGEWRCHILVVLSPHITLTLGQKRPMRSFLGLNS